MRKKLKITGLVSIATCLALACAAGYALFIEPDMLTVTKYKLAAKAIKQPLKIVFFSDTHFGSSTDQRKAKELAELINAQNADVVIFGGDFLDNYSKDKSILDIEYLKECMLNIKAAHKFAVYGNHDYGGGAVKIYKEIMQASGFQLLVNENAELADLGLEIIGVDDAYNGTYRKAQLAPKTESLPVYVCHQPDIADSILNAENAIMFSGHTHGGQILVPFITDEILPRLGRNYRKGEFAVNSGKLFVSSGIGTTSIPARFLNIPEIVVLEITGEGE